MQGPAGQAGLGGQRGPNVSTALVAMPTHRFFSLLVAVIKYHQTTRCENESASSIKPAVHLPPVDESCTSYCFPSGSQRRKRSKRAHWEAWREGALGQNIQPGINEDIRTLYPLQMYWCRCYCVDTLSKAVFIIVIIILVFVNNGNRNNMLLLRSLRGWISSSKMFIKAVNAIRQNTKEQLLSSNLCRKWSSFKINVFCDTYRLMASVLCVLWARRRYRALMQIQLHSD